MTPMPHADVVGSLLRPPELLAAQKNLEDGAIDRARLFPAEPSAHAPQSGPS